MPEKKRSRADARRKDVLQNFGLHALPAHCSIHVNFLTSLLMYSSSRTGVPFAEKHAEIIEKEKEKWFYHTKRIEEYLQGKEFCAGTKVTWPDFLLYETADFQRTLVPGSLDTYPNISAFLARYKALPQV